jgi:hypothetical protein
MKYMGHKGRKRSHFSHQFLRDTSADWAKNFFVATWAKSWRVLFFEKYSIIHVREPKYVKPCPKKVDFTWNKFYEIYQKSTKRYFSKNNKHAPWFHSSSHKKNQFNLFNFLEWAMFRDKRIDESTMSVNNDNQQEGTDTNKWTRVKIAFSVHPHFLYIGITSVTEFHFCHIVTRAIC